MAISKEETEALADKFGSDHVHVRGRGRTLKRFRENRDEDEGGSKKSRGKQKDQKSPAPIPTQVSVVLIKEGGKTQMTSTQQKPERTPTPFGNALYIARLIKSKDDPKIAELKAAIKPLNGDELRGLAFRLRNEIMEKAIGGEEYSNSPLFPVAFAAKMAGLAHNTACITGIITRQGAEFDDLVNSGLIEIKVVEGRGRKLYHFGRENLKQAAKWFRDNKNLQIANALDGHIRRSDEKRTIRQAEIAAVQEAEPEPEVKAELEPEVKETTPKTEKKNTKKTQAKKTKA